MDDIKSYIELCGARAKDASRQLSRQNSALRIKALHLMADRIRRHAAEILAANNEDLAHATDLSAPMRDRLTLNASRIEQMAASVDQIADQPEVVGKIEDAKIRPNGLKVARMRIPLGVIAIIYEARPNVTSDAAALCIKSSNAVILKGGHEALRSNGAIAHILQDALADTGLPRDSVIFIESADREAVSHLIRQRNFVDLLIPRGGEGLIRYVTEHATIPVIQHFKGNCHIFVEKTADRNKVIPILINAKCQRPGVCNAMETLLLDVELSREFQKQALESLIENGVTLHADEALMRDLGSEMNLVPATEEDWPKEYLSLELAVARVDGIEGAISHIARYTSLHTESILTEDEEKADQFLQEVNSSTVLVNASTRFADGGELGLGAEIGISTSKLHAFGPMGCADLTTRKFIVIGDGQIRL